MATKKITPAALAQRRAAAAAHWGGRGKSATIRVDAAAAREFSAAVPMLERRAVATAALRKATADFAAAK